MSCWARNSLIRPLSPASFTELALFYPLAAVADVPFQLGWISREECVGRYILGHDRSRRDERVLSDGNPTDNGGVGTD